MATDNRRAEGRRPPRRGRSDPETNRGLGEMRDEENIPLGKELPNREAREWQRRRGRSHPEPPDMHD